MCYILFQKYDGCLECSLCVELSHHLCSICSVYNWPPSICSVYNWPPHVCKGTTMHMHVDFDGFHIMYLKNGIMIFCQVTFVVTHFNDPRISSADLKDLLLQSISVLVQYKEYLVSFETNHTATLRMPKALLSAFDNRSWIPVTNILLRLCKGSGFGSSKHGETSSSSVIFQVKKLNVICLFYPTS